MKWRKAKYQNNMKRIVSSFIVFAMIFSMIVSVPGFGAEMEEDLTSDFKFKDGVITGYSGTETDLVIPEEIGGQAVREIGKQAFAKKGLTSVKFPKSLKVIGVGSFLGNNIGEIEINDGLEEIGDMAFGKCPIEELTIPGSVKKIGIRAFSNGGQLKKVDIQEGVEYIGRFAFEKNALTSVTIPGSVTNIDDAAFLNNSISEVNLGDGLQTIGNQAFVNNQIESIVIPNGLKTLARHAFESNPGFEENRGFKLYLKEPVNDINEIELEAICSTESVGLNWEETEELDNEGQKYLGHFKDFTNEDGSISSNVIDTANSNLKKMEVVANVKKEAEEPGIDENWNSNDFKFEGTAITGFSELGQEKFESNKELVIPEKTTEGKTVDSIGDRAFHLDSFGEDGIKSLTLSDTIKSIGLMAFRNNNIVDLELPDSVEKIGSGAFAANKDLETLKLSSSLKTIPQAAFSFSKIEKLEIPEGVREIGKTAFSDNKSLSDLTISTTVEKIGTKAFWGVKVAELTIPGNVKEIGSDAFFTGELSNLTLEEGIETIGRRAFKSNSLSEVMIPKSVTKLDKTAFDENSGVNIKYASLIEILEEAEEINIEGKSAENVKTLKEAIKAGKAINNKAVATLEEVNVAVENITNAINGLEDEPVTYTVRFNVNEEGATIQVKKGEDVVEPETDGSYNLKSGNYTYTVTKEGFKDVKGEFTVEAAVKTIEVILEEID